MPQTPFPCLTLYFLVIWGSCLYVYRRNAALPINDPRRRDYHPLAIPIAPFSLPFLLILWSIAFVLYSMLFAAFVIAFPFALLLIRDPRWLWNLLARIAERIGRPLLQINTALLRPFVGAPR